MTKERELRGKVGCKEKLEILQHTLDYHQYETTINKWRLIFSIVNDGSHLDACFLLGA